MIQTNKKTKSESSKKKMKKSKSEEGVKRPATTGAPPRKKFKKDTTQKNDIKGFGKPSKGKKGPISKGKSDKPTEPVDWVKFKQQKKDLRAKRRESKHVLGDLYKAKKLGENLRTKVLKGGEEERKQLVEQLHELLTGNYQKLVMMHDMARIIQYVLKFGSESIRTEVAKELTPIVKLMIQSKYAKFCIKRILKYGNSEIRSSVIKQCYGEAVKLTSHAISAPIFEYAYSTFASSKEKLHLIQEFFGDIYKNSKDDNIKHLRDVYRDSPAMKTAALSATKANLSRVINKNLFDSGLVHSVLHQFLTECKDDDKIEMIGRLSQHVVVLSNSKEGARVAMQCIWQGTNKDRKVAMKVLKEHIVELSKHEHGHCTVIALLDTVDDTVLLNKMILGQILSKSHELSLDEWGRKVILWSVAPDDTAYFHPTFLSELKTGREASTAKKSMGVRRTEILGYANDSLLTSIASNVSEWFSNASISVIAFAILKTGNGDPLKKALNSVCQLITDEEWRVKDGEKEINGIEHAGVHMSLKKLAQNDKIAQDLKITFGECLVNFLTEKTISSWLLLNRACFLLVAIFENGSEATQNCLKEKVTGFVKVLKNQTTPGARILLKKIS